MQHSSILLACGVVFGVVGVYAMAPAYPGSMPPFPGINGMPSSFEGNSFAIERVVKFLHNSMCAGLPTVNLTTVVNTPRVKVPQQEPWMGIPEQALAQPMIGRPQQQQKFNSNQKFVNGVYRKLNMTQPSRNNIKARVNDTLVKKPRMSMLFRQDEDYSASITAQENTLIRALSAAVRNVWLGTGNTTNDTVRCAELTKAEENLLKFRWANQIPLVGLTNFLPDFPVSNGGGAPPPPTYEPLPVSEPEPMWDSSSNIWATGTFNDGIGGGGSVGSSGSAGDWAISSSSMDTNWKPAPSNNFGKPFNGGASNNVFSNSNNKFPTPAMNNNNNVRKPLF